MVMKARFVRQKKDGVVKAQVMIDVPVTKVVKKDLYPLRYIAIDGKYAWKYE